MCGRERSYRIGQSGAAGWSKATKPRRHNLIMIAQELLFVNKLFKLPDLLGIGGSLRMGDSGGVWPGGQKGGIVGCPWDKKRRALARLASRAETPAASRNSLPGDRVPLPDGLSHKRTVSIREREC